MRERGGGEQATLRVDEFIARINNEVAQMLKATDIHPDDE